MEIILWLIKTSGIRTGDIVLVSEQPAGSAKKREVKDLEAKGSRGVVTRVAKTGICKFLYSSWRLHFLTGAWSLCFVLFCVLFYS